MKQTIISEWTWRQWQHLFMIYPYLVLAICKLLNKKIPKMDDFPDVGEAWTKAGIGEAVKCIECRQGK